MGSFPARAVVADGYSASHGDGQLAHGNALQPSTVSETLYDIALVLAHNYTVTPVAGPSLLTLPLTLITHMLVIYKEY